MRDGRTRAASALHERNESIRSGGRRDERSHDARLAARILWVAVKPGAKDRPPLLLFNGIGANVELAEPFMREMGDVETVIFDIPGVGGSPAAETALSSVDCRALGRRADAPARL